MFLIVIKGDLLLIRMICINKGGCFINKGSFVLIRAIFIIMGIVIVKRECFVDKGRIFINKRLFLLIRWNFVFIRGIFVPPLIHYPIINKNTLIKYPPINEKMFSNQHRECVNKILPVFIKGGGNFPPLRGEGGSVFPPFGK